MKSWLTLTAAVALFAAGMTVGRLLPNVAEAHPAPPSTETGLLQAKGATGGALSWEQYGTVLQVTVSGPEAIYLAAAELTDKYAWADYGPGDILYAAGTFELDLSSVEELTYYRMEPVATLKEGLFIPCEQLPAGCFPIRPPIGPPQPEGEVALFSQGEDLR